MLKRKYRLSAKRLIKPKTKTFSFFSVKIVENELDYPRFGFIVAKSVDKSAVVRNRTKRVFRSCIEDLLERVDTEKDFLFILKSSAKEMKRKEMLDVLNKEILEIQK